MSNIRTKFLFCWIVANDKYLYDNIQYLNDTSNTLTLVLQDIQSLIGESVTLQSNFAVQGSTASKWSNKKKYSIWKILTK